MIDKPPLLTKKEVQDRFHQINLLYDEVPENIENNLFPQSINLSPQSIKQSPKLEKTVKSNLEAQITEIVNCQICSINSSIEQIDELNIIHSDKLEELHEQNLNLNICYFIII